MKKTKKVHCTKGNQKIKFLLILLLVLISNVAPALAGDDFNNPAGEDNTPTGVPLDGGVTLLLAAGIGYGVKKAHEKRKNNRREKQV